MRYLRHLKLAVDRFKRMMNSSAVSHQTQLTSCIRTCLSSLTFPINSVPDHTA